jgi:hypothetical protein
LVERLAGNALGSADDDFVIVQWSASRPKRAIASQTSDPIFDMSCVTSPTRKPTSVGIEKARPGN